MGVGGVSDTWYIYSKIHDVAFQKTAVFMLIAMSTCMGVLLYASLSWVAEAMKVFQPKLTLFSSLTFLFKMAETLRLDRTCLPQLFK